MPIEKDQKWWMTDKWRIAMARQIWAEGLLSEMEENVVISMSAIKDDCDGVLISGNHDGVGMCFYFTFSPRRTLRGINVNMDICSVPVGMENEACAMLHPAAEKEGLDLWAVDGGWVIAEFFVLLNVKAKELDAVVKHLSGFCNHAAAFLHAHPPRMREEILAVQRSTMGDEASD